MIFAVSRSTLNSAAARTERIQRFRQLKRNFRISITFVWAGTIIANVCTTPVKKNGVFTISLNSMLIRMHTAHGVFVYFTLKLRNEQRRLIVAVCSAPNWRDVYARGLNAASAKLNHKKKKTVEQFGRDRLCNIKVFGHVQHDTISHTRGREVAGRGWKGIIFHLVHDAY